MTDRKYKSSYPEELILFKKENPFFLGSNLDIADVFGVNRHTIADWQKKHPEFLEAVETIRKRAITRAENALLKAACGFTEISRQIVENPDGTKTVRTLEKNHPPNVAAIRFLLTNRAAEDWKENLDSESTKPVIINVVDPPEDYR